MNLTPKSLFEVPFSRTKQLWLYVVDIFKYKIYKMLNNRNLSFIQELFSFCLFFFLFYLGFLSRTFTIHRTAVEGGGYLFNSSLPLPPASQTLRHQPGDYCRELTSAHSQQPDSNREPLPNLWLDILVVVQVFQSFKSS